MALAKSSAGKKKPAKGGSKAPAPVTKKAAETKPATKLAKKPAPAPAPAAPMKNGAAKKAPTPTLPAKTALPNTKGMTSKKSAPVKPNSAPAAAAPATKNAKGGKGGRGDGPSAALLAKVGSSRPSVNEAGEAVCREVACEGLATTGGYCRMHYIKNWKKIKRKELILKEKKLNQYIEELVAKYPDKYIEAIRQDLANDKDFAKVIADLDLDESIDDFEMEGDNADSFIDNIRRDFDDEGEGF